MRPRKYTTSTDAIFVQPLAKILTEFGVRVWYDEFTLRLGDSLSRSIDEGLSRSRFGLVVISPSFISKHWPEYELRGLVAREIGAGKVILPIWHNVDRATVLDFSPTLADKMALNSANRDLLHLAVEMIDVIRPDVFERIVRRIAFHKNLSSSVVPIALKEIRESPHRHAEFPEELIGRIRLIRSVLLEVYPSTMGAWLDGFRRDAHPSKEVAYWERLCTVFSEYVALYPSFTSNQRKKVFSTILLITMSSDEEAIKAVAEGLPDEAVRKLALLWVSKAPLFEVEDDCSSADLSSEIAAAPLTDVEHFPNDLPEDLIKRLIEAST